MAKITKRTKRDGTCSYCIRVSNGYDREGRQVLVNRTFTPPLGLTGKKLEKELQRQADAFEQEVHSGISLDASMKVDDLIERWFTEYAEKKLKPKTVYDYRRLVPRISAGLGQLKVCQVKPSHLMAFYSNLEEQGVREDSTYTAVPALLDQLPKGKRGQIAEEAGISERTMATLYRGGNISRATAEKVASAAGMPLSKAFIEHTKAGAAGSTETRCSTITGCCPACSPRPCSGGLWQRTRASVRKPPRRRKWTCRRWKRKTLCVCWKPCRTRLHSTVLSRSLPCSRVPAGARYAACGGLTLTWTRERFQ